MIVAFGLLVTVEEGGGRESRIDDTREERC